MRARAPQCYARWGLWAESNFDHWLMRGTLYKGCHVLLFFVHTWQSSWAEPAPTLAVRLLHRAQVLTATMGISALDICDVDPWAWHGRLEVADIGAFRDQPTIRHKIGYTDLRWGCPRAASLWEKQEEWLWTAMPAMLQMQGNHDWAGAHLCHSGNQWPPRMPTQAPPLLKLPCSVLVYTGEQPESTDTGAFFLERMLWIFPKWEHMMGSKRRTPDMDFHLSGKRKSQKDSV